MYKNINSSIPQNCGTNISPTACRTPFPFWPVAMLDDFVANAARHAPPKQSCSKEPEEKIKLCRKNNHLKFSAPGDQVRTSHVPYWRSAKWCPRKVLRNGFSRSCFHRGNCSNVVYTRCKTKAVLRTQMYPGPCTITACQPAYTERVKSGKKAENGRGLVFQNTLLK